MGSLVEMIRNKRTVGDGKSGGSSAKQVKVGNNAASSVSNQRGPDEGSIDSIRSYISYQSGCQALEFHRVDWMELSSDRLYAVFPQHTISRVLDPQQCARLLNFAANNNYSFCRIKVSDMRISNSIVLSDQIQVSATGVTEVSSFVQKGKIIMFNIDDYFAFKLKIGDNSLRMTVPNIATSVTSPRPKLIVPLNLSTPADYALNTVLVTPFLPFPNSKYQNKFGTNYQGVTNHGFFLKDVENNIYLPIQYGLIRDWDAENNRIRDSGYLTSSGIELSNTKIKDFYLVDYPHQYFDDGEEFYIPIRGYNEKQYMCNVKDFANLLASNTVVPGYTQSSSSTTPISIKTGIAPNTYPFEHAKPFDINFSFLQQRAIGKKPSKHLPCTFLGMIPINTSQNTLMKIRANIKYEMKITVEFSESEFNIPDSDNVNSANENPVNIDTQVYLTPFMRELENNGNVMDCFFR